ncbi:hypothetical protein CGLO_05124 [Colletotrichum gloeosporioides Cg-14]|uniref:Peptidase metallopeptidase domain-containing protein n=1 Tax=Colletotrichum gloeosporioides (strain Cg-14) TaxID=1237896 RepID=T0KSD6_COLGC|nr:hypothetical protein CGLO_05124 [Colletotrichum gloeosporioides Cg-14]
MLPITLVLSLFCLQFGNHVLAGSSIWQPALISRSNSSMLDKRYYYAIKEPSAWFTPWPNRVIRYCFAQDTTAAQKSMLKKYLKDARKIWISKGLDSNFRIEEVNDNVCQSESSDVLVVHYSASTLATTVGFPSNLVPFGPTMYLSDRTDIGMLDVVGNFAHELGHAWGLYHEHQNPKFWAGVDGADGGEVFGPNNPGGWNCINLKDYNSAALGLRAQTGGGGFRDLTIQQLCSNYRIAQGHTPSFSASEYLPMPGVGTPHSDGHGENDVDWQSMMIYPSGAGGYVDGEATPENDGRAPILMKPDGSRIPINLAPSSLDIAALNAMYADVEGTKLDLLNSLINFKKVYKTSKSGPSGGLGCF